MTFFVWPGDERDDDGFIGVSRVGTCSGQERGFVAPFDRLRIFFFFFMFMDRKEDFDKGTRKSNMMNSVIRG